MTETLFPELVVLDARRCYFGLGENFLIKSARLAAPRDIAVARCTSPSSAQYAADGA